VFYNGKIVLVRFLKDVSSTQQGLHLFAFKKRVNNNNINNTI